MPVPQKTENVSSESPLALIRHLLLKASQPGGQGAELVVGTCEFLDVLLTVLLYFLREPLFQPARIVLKADSGEVRWLFAFRRFPIALNALRFDRMALSAFI